MPSGNSVYNRGWRAKFRPQAGDRGPLSVARAQLENVQNDPNSIEGAAFGSGGTQFIRNWCYQPSSRYARDQYGRVVKECYEELLAVVALITFSVTLVYGTNDPGATALPAATDDVSDPFVRILCGSGDETGRDYTTFEMDLFDGASIAVPANQVISAKIIYPMLPALATQPLLDVSASIGIGDRTSQGATFAARRTIKVGNIAANAGVSPVFAIPRKAVAAYFSNTVFALNAINLEQWLDPYPLVPATSATRENLSKFDDLVTKIGQGAQTFNGQNPSVGTISDRTSIIFPLAY